MLYDISGKTDAELVAECERVAGKIGIRDVRFSENGYCSLDSGMFWTAAIDDESRRVSPLRMDKVYRDTNGKFRILTHYLPDFLFSRLSLSWQEGNALFPRLRADPDAYGLWCALLDNPRDDARLNMLRDRIEEAELLDAVTEASV
jgi:hypothetical protein